MAFSLLHQPRLAWRVVFEFFLCAAFKAACDGNSIILFSMTPFDCLPPFTASSVATSVVHISATRFVNAMIARSVVSRYPSKSMNFATLSVVHGSSTFQRNIAVHDVLVFVLPAVQVTDSSDVV